MLAAVAKAAAMEADDTENEDVKDCSCNPDDPNYSPDCDCGETAEKEDDEEDKVAKAVKAERNRVLSIAAAAFPGQEKLCARMINSGASVGDAALAFNADHKAKGAKVLASLEADESAVKGLRSEPANGAEAPKNPHAALNGEALWKAEYASSADLQAEFGSEANFLAFKRADARGGIKLMSKR
jgi:hypothetical protein